MCVCALLHVFVVSEIRLCICRCWELMTRSYCLIKWFDGIRMRWLNACVSVVTRCSQHRQSTTILSGGFQANSPTNDMMAFITHIKVRIIWLTLLPNQLLPDIVSHFSRKTCDDDDVFSELVICFFWVDCDVIISSKTETVNVLVAGNDTNESRSSKEDKKTLKFNCVVP